MVMSKKTTIAISLQTHDTLDKIIKAAPFESRIRSYDDAIQFLISNMGENGVNLLKSKNGKKYSGMVYNKKIELENEGKPNEN